jgi:hypothetical protein
MSDSRNVSPGAVVFAGILSFVALLFYALQIATLSDLASSDAAGNAYAQAYGAIEIIFLWILLCAITLIAFVKGDMPKPAAVAAAVLVPASGFVAFEALELLSRPYQPPHLWPLIIPAAIPSLVVAYCFWALLPPLRGVIPARLASGAVWGLVFILCAAIVPFDKIRNAADERDAAVIEKYFADYAKLPADAPLWDWVPFFNTRNSTQVNEILDRIRKLDRRQSDAELMLDRGDFPLGFIGRLDLTPTPALCDKARALLRKRVEPLVLATSDAQRTGAHSPAQTGGAHALYRIARPAWHRRPIWRAHLAGLAWLRRRGRVERSRRPHPQLSDVAGQRGHARQISRAASQALGV